MMDNLSPTVVVRKRPLASAEVDVSAAKRARLSADLTPPVVIESAIRPESQSMPALEVDPESQDKREQPPQETKATKADPSDLTNTDSGNPTTPVTAANAVTTTRATIVATVATSADVNPPEKTEPSGKAKLPHPSSIEPLQGGRDIEDKTVITSESPAAQNVATTESPADSQPVSVNDSVKQTPESKVIDEQLAPDSNVVIDSVHSVSNESDISSEQTISEQLSVESSLGMNVTSPVNLHTAIQIDKQIDSTTSSLTNDLPKCGEKQNIPDKEIAAPEANEAHIIEKPASPLVSEQTIVPSKRKIMATTKETASVIEEKTAAHTEVLKRDEIEAVWAGESKVALSSEKKSVSIEQVSISPVLSESKQTTDPLKKVAPISVSKEAASASVEKQTVVSVEKQTPSSVNVQSPEANIKLVPNEWAEIPPLPLESSKVVILQKEGIAIVGKPISSDVEKKGPSISFKKPLTEKSAVLLELKKLPTPTAKQGPTTAEMNTATKNILLPTSVERHAEELKEKQSPIPSEKRAPTFVEKQSVSVNDQASSFVQKHAPAPLEKRIPTPIPLQKQPAASSFGQKHAPAPLEKPIPTPIPLQKQPAASEMKAVSINMEKQSPSLVVEAKATRAKPSPVTQVIQDSSVPRQIQIGGTIDLSESSPPALIAIAKPLPSAPVVGRSKTLPAAHYGRVSARPDVIDLIDSDDEPEPSLSRNVQPAMLPGGRRYQYQFNPAGYQISPRSSSARMSVNSRQRQNLPNQFSPSWKQRYELALKTGNRNFLMETLQQYPQLQQRVMMGQQFASHLQTQPNRLEYQTPRSSQQPQAPVVFDLTGDDSEPESPAATARPSPPQQFQRAMPSPPQQFQRAMPSPTNVYHPTVHLPQKLQKIPPKEQPAPRPSPQEQPTPRPSPQEQPAPQEIAAPKEKQTLKPSSPLESKGEPSQAPISSTSPPKQPKASAKRYYEESDTETDDDSNQKPPTKNDEHLQRKLMRKITAGAEPTTKVNSEEPPKKRQKIEEPKSAEGEGRDEAGCVKKVPMFKKMKVQVSSLGEPPKKRQKIEEAKSAEGGGGVEGGGVKKVPLFKKIELETDSQSLVVTEEIKSMKEVLENASKGELLKVLGELKGETALALLKLSGPEKFQQLLIEGICSKNTELQQVAKDLVATFPRKSEQATMESCPEYNLPSDLPKFSSGLVIVFALFSAGDDKLSYYLECARKFVRVMTQVFPKANFHCHSHGLSKEQQARVFLYARPESVTITEYVFDSNTEGLSWLVSGARFRTALEITTDDTVLICDIHENFTLQLQQLAKLHALVLENKKQCGLTYWQSAEDECPYGVDFGGLLQKPEGFTGHYHTSRGLQLWLPGSLRTLLNKSKFWEFCIEKASELRIVSKGIDEIFFDWFIANNDGNKIFYKNAVFLPRQSNLKNEQKSADSGSSTSSNSIGTNIQEGNICRIEEKYSVKTGEKDFFLCAGYRTTNSKKID